MSLSSLPPRIVLPLWVLAVLPALAAVVGAIASGWLNPGPRVVSGIRHFAAGVVFAAAAGEVLPHVIHSGSPVIATLIGGALGVGLMLLVKKAEDWISGPAGLIAAIGIDFLVDGLVLGVALHAGGQAGLLIAIALICEVLSLGLALTSTLSETLRSRARVVGTVAALSLALPLGALLATPVSLLPEVWFTTLLAMGLVALLYLVTEELLVEAHEVEDSAAITAMFFIGFLGLLLLEEFVG